MIGKRAMQSLQLTKSRRIKYGRDMMQKEVLPHLGIAPNCENKKVRTPRSVERLFSLRKQMSSFFPFPHVFSRHANPPLVSSPRQAYFLGYMVHRTLQAALRRRELDGRDHYGNKRLDLAGPLMAYLFRTLFKKLTKDLKIKLTRAINKGTHFNVSSEIDVRQKGPVRGKRPAGCQMRARAREPLPNPSSSPSCPHRFPFARFLTGNHHRVEPAVQPGHGQLGRPHQGGAGPRGRVAGAQPPDLCLDALALAPPQLAH